MLFIFGCSYSGSLIKTLNTSFTTILNILHHGFSFIMNIQTRFGVSFVSVATIRAVKWVDFTSAQFRSEVCFDLSTRMAWKHYKYIFRVDWLDNETH